MAEKWQQEWRGKWALITGASAGIGLELAKLLAAGGANLVLTARRVDRLQKLAADLASQHGTKTEVFAADLTRPEAPGEIYAFTASRKIEVEYLINNAGFGAASPVEAIPLATVRELFEINTFGTMAVTQAVLPQFRQRKAGVVVNVTSSVTLKSIPLVASYTASKAAVNAFTESMALELEQFGVRARLVLPGRSPQTRFGDNAHSHTQGLDHEAYVDLVKSLFARFAEPGPITHAQDVAEAVWRAATDPLSPMRIPAGADAEAWAAEAH